MQFQKIEKEQKEQAQNVQHKQFAQNKESSYINTNNLRIKILLFLIFIIIVSVIYVLNIYINQNNLQLQENKKRIQLQKKQLAQKKYWAQKNKIQLAQLRQFVKKRAKLRNIPLDNPLSIQQHNYFQKKYNIDNYKQLPICVVVPSYNNVKDNRHYNNMASILQQNYTNYKVLFIDDASTDNTGAQMTQFIKKNDLKKKVTVKINQQHKLAMQNLKWAAVNFCKPQDIFMIVDGDDELLGKQVFKFQSAIYQQKEVWVFSTEFAFKDSFWRGFSYDFRAAVIKQNSYRQTYFSISHLRSFYTKLFLLIEDKDLRDSNGQYFRVNDDLAMYLPMLEMAHTRVLFIKEIMYLYNENTSLHDYQIHFIRPREQDRKLRFYPQYSPIDKLF